MKKINVLFDATVIALSYNYKGFRAGLFFVAYNILRQFVNDEKYKTILYVHECIDAVSNFKNDELLSKFYIYTNNSNDSYRNNIKNHKENIKSTGNYYRKFIYCLKILKNKLLMVKNNYSDVDLLKSMDIYFSPFSPVPSEILKYPKMKRFLILYDTMPVIFPDYFPDLADDNYWFYKLIKITDKQTYYFCISESTKYDFLKYFNQQFNENKMLVTHIASAQLFVPDYDKKKLNNILEKYNIKYKENNNYILSFCTIEPRKNLIFTVNCFIKFIIKHKINDLYFYLGGLQWDFFIKQLEEKNEGFDDYSNKIIRLGYVDDEDVNILYSNSLFFVYLSQYEGFGLPPLEAMQAGTPVITSNNSSLPEVVGDAGIMIDYNNEDQCIKAFEDFYFNDELRNHYIRKGIERAKLFSWEKTFSKMNEIIQKELKN